MPSLVLPYDTINRQRARCAGDSAYPQLWRGLVGAWDGNYNYGRNNRLWDLSGRNNTGTLTNMSSPWVGSSRGGAMQFDGVTGYVLCGNATPIQNLTAFSMVAWVFPRSRGEANDGRIMHKGTSTARKQLQSWSAVTNAFALLVDRATSQALRISVANTMELNIWQCVAGTYNETDGPRVYKNGREVSYSTDQAGSGATTNDSGDSLYLGNRADDTRTWDGFIKMALYYNRVLSQSEIMSLYLGAHPLIPKINRVWISPSAPPATDTSLIYNPRAAFQPLLVR